MDSLHADDLPLAVESVKELEEKVRQWQGALEKKLKGSIHQRKKFQLVREERHKKLNQGNG